MTEMPRVRLHPSSWVLAPMPHREGGCSPGLLLPPEPGMSPHKPTSRPGTRTSVTPGGSGFVRCTLSIGLAAPPVRGPPATGEAPGSLGHRCRPSGLPPTSVPNSEAFQAPPAQRHCWQPWGQTPGHPAANLGGVRSETLKVRWERKQGPTPTLCRREQSLCGLRSWLHPQPTCGAKTEG